MENTGKATQNLAVGHMTARECINCFLIHSFQIKAVLGDDPVSKVISFYILKNVVIS